MSDKMTEHTQEIPDSLRFDKGRWYCDGTEYGVPISIFKFSVENLKIATGASADPNWDFKAPVGCGRIGPIKSTIRGTGVFNDKFAYLGIIGRKELKTKKFNVAINIANGEQHDPESISDLEIEQASDYKQYTQLIRVKAKPACELYFCDGINELTPSEEWNINVNVTNNIFSEILIGIRNGRINLINIGISFYNIYSPDFFSSDCECRWHLPPEGLFLSAYGNVNYICWDEKLFGSDSKLATKNTIYRLGCDLNDATYEAPVAHHNPEPSANGTFEVIVKHWANRLASKIIWVVFGAVGAWVASIF